jgi:hypothetical protein
MNTILRCAFLVLMLMMATSTTRAEDAWVQVRESFVRSEPAFFGSKVAGVKYGDRVTKSSEQEGWAKVSFRGQGGFLPSSTITPAQIVLSGRSGGKIKAEASDIVLAGKGFSKEVEESYKKQESAARFDLVDQVERQCRVSSSEVSSFLKQGGLNG